METIESRVEKGVLIIKINGLVHLTLDLQELVAIQSWKEEKGLWSIEYYLKTTKILTEYDRIDRWKEILKQLEGLCLLQSDK